MKLTMTRSVCQTGRQCANINRTDRNTLVVQGDIVAPAIAERFELSYDMTVVEIPQWLVPELKEPGNGLHFTERGTILVVGRRIIDPEALLELSLPVGEDAVEIAADTFPIEVTANA